MLFRSFPVTIQRDDYEGDEVTDRQPDTIDIDHLLGTGEIRTVGPVTPVKNQSSFDSQGYMIKSGKTKPGSGFVIGNVPIGRLHTEIIKEADIDWIRKHSQSNDYIDKGYLVELVGEEKDILYPDSDMTTAFKLVSNRYGSNWDEAVGQKYVFEDGVDTYVDLAECRHMRQSKGEDFSESLEKLYNGIRAENVS